MSRLQAVLARDRVLPLFTPEELPAARRRLTTLQEAGIEAVELTARVPDAAARFGMLRREFPDLLLGAGTILDAETARTFLEQGADFVVGPCLVPGVASACREAGVPYLPGAATVREVVEAQAAGAAVVKVFPGDVLGTAFVRALRGPLPGARLLVTGGVAPTPASVRDWLEAGALAVGLGSSLFGLPDDEWPGCLNSVLTLTRGDAS
ncbi:bifunctional 4-hydroxy-2-oxoglutarate aldolase/2-dehydro-3-deoxy-phosphogluconate aldolase [Deinococcus navajonensis]|uniref:Bifunctional 4-hydroxy-2-oxoglutarate aldolase/2-dehydro-3-deoxy-phosphogluconate aldolase n=1 Tax=Deinococcus navajonensis TaxID=309884 RepID=A0ABV8XQX2_9DEIO